MIILMKYGKIHLLVKKRKPNITKKKVYLDQEVKNFRLGKVLLGEIMMYVVILKDVDGVKNAQD